MKGLSCRVLFLVIYLCSTFIQVFIRKHSSHLYYSDMPSLPLKLKITILLFLNMLVSLLVSGQVPSNRISYQQYIDTYKEIAIKKMMEYKIPASITLAQGLLESGSGNSDLSINAKNHFGIKCHKEWTGMTYIMDDDEKGECFRKYSSAEESFNDHSLFLTTRPRYANLFELDIHDYKGWAYGLKAAGYATNPRYAEMLIKIIEENQLFLYDSGGVNGPILADLGNKKPVTPSSPPAKESKKLHRDKSAFKYVEVTNGNRSIYTNNGVKLTYARQGDNAQKIADDVGVHTFQILQYNELGRNEVIQEGAIIYIEPKKKKADKEYHIVTAEETMRDIAQLYGVKLKTLYKRNDMQMGHEPIAGAKLYLRKKK